MAALNDNTCDLPQDSVIISTMDTPVSAIKICIKCKVAKPLTAFYAHKETKKGIRRTCIECTSAEYQEMKREKAALALDLQSVKACSKCKVVQPYIEFFSNPTTKTGRGSQCKTCMHASYVKNKEEKSEYNKLWRAANSAQIAENKKQWMIDNKEYAAAQNRERRTKNPSAWKDGNLRRYGLTWSTYLDMLEKQGGVCAICDIPATECTKGLYVDHNHTTGEVRALLCLHCNSALGYVRESLDVTLSLAKYIQDHEKKP